MKKHTSEELTNEELVINYQDGDDYAATILWQRNQGLIHKTINKFNNYDFIEKEDKMSACSKAFVTSIKKFDGSKGYKFTTYLGRAMYNEIIQEGDASGKNRNAMNLKTKVFSYDNQIPNAHGETEFWERLEQFKVEDEYFKVDKIDSSMELKKAFDYAVSKINKDYQEHLPKVYYGELTAGEVAEITGKSPQSVNYQLRAFEKNVVEQMEASKRKGDFDAVMKKYLKVFILEDKKEEFLNDLSVLGINKNSKVTHINNNLEKCGCDYRLEVDEHNYRENGVSKRKRYWKVVSLNVVGAK